MRISIACVIVAGVMSAGPAFAQEHGAIPDSRGYVSAMGGFVSASGTTGDLLFEAGARVWPHVQVFGDVGQFHNLQSELQPTLTNTTTSLDNTELFAVSGSGTLPAWYTQAGVRADIPNSSRVLPYVLGGVGIAHLSPTVQLAFLSGTLPDGSVPPAGQDVTGTLTSNGLFTAPASSNAFMFTLGGGVQIPIAPRWAVDAGYRFSRIAADTSLSANPLNAQGMTFGVGYRF